MKRKEQGKKNKASGTHGNRSHNNNKHNQKSVILGLKDCELYFMAVAY